MLVSKLFSARFACPIKPLNLVYHLHIRSVKSGEPPKKRLNRPLRPSRGEDDRFHNGKPASAPQPQETISLYEELFPQEAANERAKKPTKDVEPQAMPRLRRLELQHEGPDETARPKEIAQTALTSAFRVDNAAILCLSAASDSLSESDFRRIAPKGKHIKDWNGPGDILKVFPGRNPSTLTRNSQYFLVFSNPANARVYQHHILRLHRISKAYTPTSIESPTPPQPRRRPTRLNPAITRSDEAEGIPDLGLVHERAGHEQEDTHAQLRDFALCPPSQPLRLKIIQAPFGTSIRKLMHDGGYGLITRGGPHGEDRTGRAVLFWIDGPPSPNTRSVEQAIGADGIERGMPWGAQVEVLEEKELLLQLQQGARHQREQEQEQNNEEEEHELDEIEEREFRNEMRGRVRRWILTFGEADQARRFARRWHRRVFPMLGGSEEMRACVEVLW